MANELPTPVFLSLNSLTKIKEFKNLKFDELDILYLSVIERVKIYYIKGKSDKEKLEIPPHLFTFSETYPACLLDKTAFFIRQGIDLKKVLIQDGSLLGNFITNNQLWKKTELDKKRIYFINSYCSTLKKFLLKTGYAKEICNFNKENISYDLLITLLGTFLFLEEKISANGNLEKIREISKKEKVWFQKIIKKQKLSHKSTISLQEAIQLLKNTYLRNITLTDNTKHELLAVIERIDVDGPDRPCLRVPIVDLFICRLIYFFLFFKTLEDAPLFSSDIPKMLTLDQLSNRYKVNKLDLFKNIVSTKLDWYINIKDRQSIITEDPSEIRINMIKGINIYPDIIAEKLKQISQKLKNIALYKLSEKDQDGEETTYVCELILKGNIERNNQELYLDAMPNSNTLKILNLGDNLTIKIKDSKITLDDVMIPESEIWKFRKIKNEDLHNVLASVTNIYTRVDKASLKMPPKKQKARVKNPHALQKLFISVLRQFRKDNKEINSSTIWKHVLNQFNSGSKEYKNLINSIHDWDKSRSNDCFISWLSPDTGKTDQYTQGTFEKDFPYLLDKSKQD